MTPDYYTIGIVLASLFFLLQVISVTVSIWSRLRRQPSLENTLKEYVLKEDFNTHCTQNDRSLKELYDLQREGTKLVASEIKDLSTNLGTWQQGIAQQIGRLEGQAAATNLGTAKGKHE